MEISLESWDEAEYTLETAKHRKERMCHRKGREGALTPKEKLKG